LTQPEEAVQQGKTRDYYRIYKGRFPGQTALFVVWITPLFGAARLLDQLSGSA
jgi:hypothetical protein